MNIHVRIVSPVQNRKVSGLFDKKRYLWPVMHKEAKTTKDLEKANQQNKLTLFKTSIKHTVEHTVPSCIKSYKMTVRLDYCL